MGRRIFKAGWTLFWQLGGTLRPCYPALPGQIARLLGGRLSTSLSFWARIQVRGHLLDRPRNNVTQ